MSRWFRHYAGMARDEKLVSVAIKSKQTIERVVWVWAAILESAAEIDANGRFDVDAAEIAYFLRADEADIHAILAGLAGAGRVSADCVVKWGERQFSSDRSAARQAAYRDRKRAETTGSDDNKTSANVSVTSLSRHGDAPETELELETEEEKKEEAAVAEIYEFEGRVIKLKPDDLKRWRKSYPDVDLMAALQSRDDWLVSENKTKNWFISTSNHLASLQKRSTDRAREPAWSSPC